MSDGFYFITNALAANPPRQKSSRRASPADLCIHQWIAHKNTININIYIYIYYIIFVTAAKKFTVDFCIHQWIVHKETISHIYIYIYICIYGWLSFLPFTKHYIHKYQATSCDLAAFTTVLVATAVCSPRLFARIALTDCSPRLYSQIALPDCSPRLLPQIALPDCSPRLLSQIALTDCSPRLLSQISLPSRCETMGYIWALSFT